jgi:hypothetical protein
MLTQYPGRNLSYDADALDAVLGILNHLHTEPDHVDSIWGVSFTQYFSEGDRSKLCIHWEHPEPTTRRRGFRSWYPLGWHGPVGFSQGWAHYALSGDELAKLSVSSIGLHRAKYLQPNSIHLEIKARLLRFPVVIPHGFTHHLTRSSKLEARTW